MDKELIKELKILKLNSTRVVAWYDHGDTVRGPWNRWFRVENPERNRQGKDNVVPPGSADTAYCAAAMNAVPDLIKEIEKLESQLGIAWSWLEHSGKSINGKWDCLQDGNICSKCEILNHDL